MSVICSAGGLVASAEVNGCQTCITIGENTQKTLAETESPMRSRSQRTDARSPPRQRASGRILKKPNFLKDYVQ